MRLIVLGPPGFGREAIVDPLDTRLNVPAIRGSDVLKAAFRASNQPDARRCAT